MHGYVICMYGVTRLSDFFAVVRALPIDNVTYRDVPPGNTFRQQVKLCICKICVKKACVRCVKRNVVELKVLLLHFAGISIIWPQQVGYIRLLRLRATSCNISFNVLPHLPPSNFSKTSQQLSPRCNRIWLGFAWPISFAWCARVLRMKWRSDSNLCFLHIGCLLTLVDASWPANLNELHRYTV